MVKLAIKSVDRLLLSEYLGDYEERGTNLKLRTNLTLTFLDWVDLGTIYVPLSTKLIGSLWGPYPLFIPWYDIVLPYVFFLFFIKPTQAQFIPKLVRYPTILLY